MELDLVGMVVGNYRLLSFLGRGGFADVYLGEHIYLGTQVAVKILHTVSIDENINEFLKDVRKISGLDHPNIVKVVDFGIERNRFSFLVMKYASQGTLRQLHPKGSILTPQQILPYIKQVASAAHYAHNLGLVHRDIKPENMLIDDGKILLGDFGLALITANSYHQGTQNSPSGTVAYMAPEQLQGKPSLFSDQYALGVVVYEWLCGRLPFQGSYWEIATQHLVADPIPPHEVSSAVPFNISRVILTALNKDPQGRFASILDFINAFEQACSSSSQRERWSLIEATPCGTPISTYHGHSGKVTSVSWSPDSEKVVSADLDGTVQLWNVATGEPVLKYYGHFKGEEYNHVYAVAWSPDGKQIISGGIAGVQLWDAQTGLLKMLPPVKFSNGSIRDIENIEWSRDGKKVAISSTYEVCIWEIPSMQLIATFHCYQGIFALSPDSKFVATGNNRFKQGESSKDTVEVWEIETSKIVCTYEGNYTTVKFLAWSPDSKYVASRGGMELHVLHAQSGNLLYMQNSSGKITWPGDEKSTAFSNGMDLITFFDSLTGKFLRDNHFPFDEIHLSPNNQYFAAIYKNIVQVFKAKNNIAEQAVFKGIGSLSIDPPLGTILMYLDSRIIWSPDTKLVAELCDREIKVWNINTGETLSSYKENRRQIQEAAWSPDGSKIVFACGDLGLNPDADNVHVFDVQTGQKLFGCKGYYSDEMSKLVWTVSWSPDNRHIAFAGFSYYLQIWDIASKRHILSCDNRVFSGVTSHVRWSPDGKFLASVGYGQVFIWNVRTGDCILTYQGHSKSVTTIAWSPCGRYIASGSQDTTVQVWNSLTGECILTYRGHSPDPKSKEYDEDVQNEEYDEDYEYDEDEPRPEEKRTGFLKTLDWSPDGKKIASGAEDSNIQIWDAFTGDLIFTYRGHYQEVYKLSWSPNGKYIASRGSLYTHIWQAV